MSNRRNKSLILLGVLVLGGCASSARPADGYNPENEKSPLKATLIAIFPGFFVHGAGNWYAGKNNRRDELLEEEGLGLGAMALGAGLGGLGYLEHLEADKSTGVMMILNRMGEVGSFVGAAGLEGYGLICFFDSWIRDIMEAGDAAEARNRDLRRNRELYLPLKPDASVVDSMTAAAPNPPPSSTRMTSDPR